jgi:hypothetical protein
MSTHKQPNSNSRYQAIWLQIKANPNSPITVDAAPEFHPRLIKAVIKRKYIDSMRHPNAINGKLEVSYDELNARLVHFTLRKILL